MCQVRIGFMIISGKDIYYYPISSLDGDTPIEFNVTGSDEYIDLNSIFLYLEVNITKADGTAFANTVSYAPVNKFKDALFSQAEVYLNGENVSGSNNTYPYRAYIEALTSYGQDSKESYITSDLWNKDTSGKMDNVTDKAATGILG